VSGRFQQCVWSGIRAQIPQAQAGRSENQNRGQICEGGDYANLAELGAKLRILRPWPSGCRRTTLGAGRSRSRCSSVAAGRTLGAAEPEVIVCYELIREFIQLYRIMATAVDPATMTATMSKNQKVVWRQSRSPAETRAQGVPVRPRTALEHSPYGLQRAGRGEHFGTLVGPSRQDGEVRIMNVSRNLASLARTPLIRHRRWNFRFINVMFRHGDGSRSANQEG